MSDNPTTISVTFDDLDILQAAYMPYLKNGGLFIPTEQPFALGQRVSLELNFFSEPMKALSVSVVWVTPVGAQGNRAPGIGVAFEADCADALRTLIETKLADKLESDQQTHTL